MSLQIGKEVIGIHIPLDIVFAIRLWALAESKSITAFLTEDVFSKLIANEKIDPYDEKQFIAKIANSYLNSLLSKRSIGSHENIKANVNSYVSDFRELLRRRRLSAEHIKALEEKFKELVEEL